MVAPCQPGVEGTRTIPVFERAKSISINSQQFLKSIPTRSPFFIPQSQNSIGQPVYPLIQLAKSPPVVSINQCQVFRVLFYGSIDEMFDVHVLSPFPFL